VGWDAVNEALLMELHRSLDERWRPEEIAAKIRGAPPSGLDGASRAALNRVARHSRGGGWSSMSRDFARPPGMGRQLAVAGTLFGVEAPPVDPGDDDRPSGERLLHLELDRGSLEPGP
jgi:hypothetical protein